MRGATALEGKVALITGAARGIGLETALALARAGADVALLDRCARCASTPYPAPQPQDLQRAETAVEATGRRAIAVRADVTVAADMAAAAARTLSDLGGLDIVVCNAGIFSWGSLWELTEEQWDETIDINLKGVWLTLKATVPYLIEQRSGRIVLISSTAGLRGDPDISHYSASKHGVIGLMRSLATEVGEYGITVNAVCPTRLKTPMVTFGAYYERATGRPRATESDLAEVNRKEHLLPVDFVPVRAVADAVVWLVSEEASFITGTALPVDAGELLL